MSILLYTICDITFHALQDEDIEIEDEIDSDDPVVIEEGELCGAQFLEQFYILNTQGI